MTNKWVEFVRKWAKKHRQTYMCAASKQKCREEYHAAYPKKGSTRKMESAKNAGHEAVGVRGFAGEISEAQRRESRKSIAITRKTRKNKTRMQRELLKKFKPYAEHRRRKGMPVE